MPAHDLPGGPLAPLPRDSAAATSAAPSRRIQRVGDSALDELSRNAAIVSVARREKRSDAVALLRAISEERAVRRAGNASADAVRVTAGRRTRDVVPRDGYGEWRPQHVSASRAGGVRVGDERGSLTGAEPLVGCAAVASYMHPGQVTSAATGSAVPMTTVATRLLAAAAKPARDAQVLRLRVIAPLRQALTVPQRPGAARASSTPSLHLAQEVVRRCLASQGWRAALSVVVAVTSGSGPGRLDGGAVGAPAVALYTTFMKHMGRLQTDGASAAAPAVPPDNGMLDVGNWESSLACAAALVGAVATDAKKAKSAAPPSSKRTAAVQSHIIFAALARRPPSVFDLVHASAFRPWARDAHAPWDAALRCVTAQLPLPESSWFAVSALTAPNAVRPPEDEGERRFVAEAADTNRAALTVLAAASGGGSLERVQQTVDRLCDVRPRTMRDPAVWAGYIQACGIVDLMPAARRDPLQPPHDHRRGASAAAWRHGLEVMGRNTLEYGLDVTPSMYEAAMGAAMAPDFADVRWTAARQARQRGSVVTAELPTTAQGWRMALRLYNRAETAGVAPSQAMLGHAVLASLLGRSRGWRDEEAVRADDDATSSLASGESKLSQSPADGACRLCAGVVAMPEAGRRATTVHPDGVPATLVAFDFRRAVDVLAANDAGASAVKLSAAHTPHAHASEPPQHSVVQPDAPPAAPADPDDIFF